MSRWYERVSSPAVSDRSFVRWGGLAAVLLAVTSWLATGAYYALGKGGSDLVGMEMFALVSALVGFWALFAIVAMHWMLRGAGEAWSLFAMVVGVVAAVLGIAAALYPIAFTRAVLARPLEPSARFPVSIAATDPLNVVSFALAGLWFLVIGLLLWRGAGPRRLAGLAFITAAALFFGFVAGLSGDDPAVTFAALAAGAVTAPLFWIWAGVRALRTT